MSGEASGLVGCIHEGDSREIRSSFRFLCLIIIAGAVVRLGLWQWWQGTPELIVDAQDYNRLAIGLAQTGKYMTEAGEPSSLRPPLYPLFVSLVYRTWGLENFQAVRAMQAAISLGTVGLVFRLGCLVADRSVGLAAALMVCFYPSLLAYNNLLLSETLFTFFVTASVWTIVEGIHRVEWRWLIASGVLLGMGALTRSILWLFAPVVCLSIIVVWQGRFAQRLGAAIVVGTLCLLTVLPWAYRNTVVQKTFTMIDVMGGRNVMMGNYEFTPLERSWATITDVNGDRAWHVVLRQRHPELQGATQGQLDKTAMKEGLSYMIGHPGLTLKRSIVRFFNFWQLERELVAGAKQGMFGAVSHAEVLIVAIVVVGSYAIFIQAAIFGIFLTSWGAWRLHGVILLTILFPCAVHSLIFAHSRYHLPGIPLLSLYAAYLIVNWRRIWLRHSTLGLRLAIITNCLLTLGWIRELLFVDLPYIRG